MSKLSPARKLALDVLMEADRRGMYARDVLSSRASAKAIDQRDSAFAARLALGVAVAAVINDCYFCHDAALLCVDREQPLLYLNGFQR